MIQVTRRIFLRDEELHFVFIRPSGPGGQRANKVATAVQLRFDLLNSSSLPEPVRRRLALLAGRRLTSKGIIVIEARRFRKQERNRRDALERLIRLIRSAAREKRSRRLTRPSATSRKARLADKRRRSRTKQLRRRVRQDEE